MAEFFAGVNTEKGFIGFPGEYFSPLSRLYIIKGTAGSGKSTLMKRLADECEKKGFTVHRVRCSSDPQSLDGVILPEKGAGVADGTSPHILEADTPIAREILVDAGRYMDEKKLDKEGIILYSRKKKEYYSRAYRFITCGVEGNRVCGDIAASALEKEKLESFARRFFRKHMDCGKKGRVHTRISAAFTGKGIKVLDAFPDTERVFTLKGGRGTEYILLDMLYAMGKSEGADMYISPDATDSRRINGIYFTEKRVYVTLLPSETGTDINMARFFLASEYSSAKSALKESRDLAKSAYDLAEKNLFAAAACHGELEKRYIAAMDFEPLEEEYKRILTGLTE